MKEIHEAISSAQYSLSEILSNYLSKHETTRDQYIRYLSFQYHLTKDVQRYFLKIAAHPDLSRRRKLRAFLFSFANEEELHYLVAANDLDKLGTRPLAMPFDVELWHAYFNSIIDQRPFVRLGAATVLENISDGVARPWVKKALFGPFLTKDTTKFLVLHQHEALPHGEQILGAIAQANLSAEHMRDLGEGARKGAVLYLRMARWALEPGCDSALCDTGLAQLETHELERVRSFDMAQLSD